MSRLRRSPWSPPWPRTRRCASPRSTPTAPSSPRSVGPWPQRRPRLRHPAPGVGTVPRLPGHKSAGRIGRCGGINPDELVFPGARGGIQPGFGELSRPLQIALQGCGIGILPGLRRIVQAAAQSGPRAGIDAQTARAGGLMLQQVPRKFLQQRLARRLPGRRGHHGGDRLDLRSLAGSAAGQDSQRGGGPERANEGTAGERVIEWCGHRAEWSRTNALPSSGGAR